MRIEPLQQSISNDLKPTTAFKVLPAGSFDSIEAANVRPVAWVKAKVIWARAMVFRFYRYFEGLARRALSCFFPVRPYPRIPLKIVDYMRLVEDGRNRYRILINGVSSDNEVIYTVRDGVVYIGNIQFPDKGLREHLGSIFAHILADEEANAFSTNYFDLAKFLWHCGFEPGGATIRYYPEDQTSRNQDILRTLIETAQQRRDEGDLPESYVACLTRIEQAISDWTLLDGFVDIAASVNLMDERAPTADLLLSDVLQLIDGLKIDRLHGITFDATTRHWVRFTKTD